MMTKVKKFEPIFATVWQEAKNFEKSRRSLASARAMMRRIKAERGFYKLDKREPESRQRDCYQSDKTKRNHGHDASSRQRSFGCHAIALAILLLRTSRTLWRRRPWMMSHVSASTLSGDMLIAAAVSSTRACSLSNPHGQNNRQLLSRARYWRAFSPGTARRTNAGVLVPPSDRRRPMNRTRRC